MKHKLSITIIILSMFLITQFIGLYVVNHYSSDGNKLPYGMDTPKVNPTEAFSSIVVSFIIAIALLFLLIHFKVDVVLRIWFLAVITLALAISLDSFIPKFHYGSYVIIAIAIALASLKVFKRNFIIHNATELLIYPGIAAVFVPILNLWTLVVLLILISLYDMWAVWKSGIMQKMAKYQMDKVKVFGGFFVPYLSKKQKQKIKKAKKDKSKNKKKIKVNVAILGGGDVVFPIIASGVMLNLYGLLPAILTIAGALLGLGLLLIFSKKKKFYPAMPFISAGIFFGMFITYLI